MYIDKHHQMSRDALITGINYYPFFKDGQTGQPKHLRTPVEDATAIAQLLETYGNFLTQKLIVPYIDGVGEDTNILPTSEQLVRTEDLETAIKQLFIPNSATPPKTALLFFSGHGLRLENNTDESVQGYLATCDADGKQKLGISLSWLCQILEKSPVRQQIVWLDCCHSGELVNAWQLQTESNYKQTRFFITASRDFEAAYNSPSGKYGALTELLLQALKPEQYTEGVVTNHTLINLINKGLGGLSQRPLVFPNTVESGKIYLTCSENNKSFLTSETRQDWGTTLNIDHFFGRTNELEKLRQWILEEYCRLVAILGIGGMGKTQLAINLKLTGGNISKTNLSQNLAQKIHDEFDYIIWRSLNNPIQVSTLLADLIKFLSNQKEFELPETLDGQISRLLYYLRSSRCLLILDNLEQILKSTERDIQYNDGYDGYSELFRIFGGTEHQSCLLLTTREIPEEIENLEKDFLSVRLLELTGLDYSAGQKIFQANGSFSGSDDEWEKLTDYYNGNPLALKLAVDYIKKQFKGSISDFLKQEDKPVFDKLNELLDWHFERLSDLEQEVMYWLAINRESVSLSKLKEDLLSRQSKKNLSSTLSSLKTKLLLENKEEYSLHPVLIEYLTERLVQNAVEEITNEDEDKEKNTDFLNKYALLKALADDYVRESQIELIIKPIWQELEEVLGSEEQIDIKLNEIIHEIRQNTHLKKGYKAGNILNLLCQNKSKVVGYDFSHLNIYQACLKGVNLEQVSFAYSNIGKSSFLDKLGNIFSITFSRDGKLLAAGEANGDILIWQVTNAQTIAICTGHTDWIRSVVFSPDGKTLVSGSEDKTIKLWSVDTGQCLKTLYGHNNWVRSVVFSTDGTTLISGSADQTIKLWDVNTEECLDTWYGHTDLIESVALSPDGQMVASGSDDQTIKLWDIKTGECCHTLYEHTQFVRCVSFSPDGKILASSSDDKTIRLWDSTTWKCINILHGHNNFVRSVTWSADSKKLASCSDDRTIKLWDVSKGECKNTLQGHRSRVWGVSFKLDGEIVASGSADQTVKLWSVGTGQCLNTLQGYTNWFLSAVFSPDGTTIAGGSEDGYIRLWNVANKEDLKIFKGHSSWIRSIKFSPDGKTLVSGSDDKTIKLWDVTTEKCLNTFYGHKHWIRQVTFSPDAKNIISCSNDKVIKLWDVSTGECLKTLEGHTASVQSLNVSPNGQIIASCSDDKTIKLWDISTGQCLKTLEGHNDYVRSIVFIPDGTTLISGSADETIKLWDVTTGKCLNTITGDNDWIWSVAISPDGKIIASGSSKHEIKLWDIKTRKCLKTLKQHTNRVCSVFFHPQGNTLCSSSEDETVKLWNIQTGECIETFRAKRPYENVDITGVTGLTEVQNETLTALGAITGR